MFISRQQLEHYMDMWFFLTVFPVPVTQTCHRNLFFLPGLHSLWAIPSTYLRLLKIVLSHSLLKQCFLLFQYQWPLYVERWGIRQAVSSICRQTLDPMKEICLYIHTCPFKFRDQTLKSTYQFPLKLQSVKLLNQIIHK